MAKKSPLGLFAGGRGALCVKPPDLQMMMKQINLWAKFSALPSTARALPTSSSHNQKLSEAFMEEDSSLKAGAWQLQSLERVRGQEVEHKASPVLTL